MLPSCAVFIGQCVPGLDTDNTPVSKDMADAVQIYLDTVYEALKARPRAKLIVEQKFKLPFLAPDLDGSIPGGTNDACIYYPDTQTADLYDYKHGAGKWVDVRGNKQLLYYALGAQTWFSKQGIALKGMRVTIVQPRCTMGDEPVRSVDVSLDELFDFREDALAAACAARSPTAKCNPGPWCKGTWCKGALQLACEAFKTAATQGIIETPKRGAQIFDIPAVDLTPQTIDPTRMDSAELGRRLEQLPLLTAYIACLRDFAESEAQAGRMPQGYKWVLGNGRREWTAPESEVLAKLQRQTNGADFAPRKLVSVAEAEKLLGKTKFKNASDLKGLYGAIEGKPKLAPLSDSKPAYVGPVELEPVEIGE